MMKKIILFLMLIFSQMSTIYSQSKEMKITTKEDYKNSVTKDIQKKIDSLLNIEVAQRGGEYPGSVILSSYSPEGPVTQQDIDKIKESFKKLIPPRNNFKNHLGLIRRNLDVLDMAYEMSNDTWFLDKMIEVCDHMIDGQNGPGKYKSITGEYEYYWPQGFAVKDGEVYANLALFTNGVIVGRIMKVVQRILENEDILDNETKTKDHFHFGSTYRERATSYIDRATKTLDYLIKYSHQKATDLLVYPEENRWSPRPDFVGTAPAWNRYFMLGMGFMNASTTFTKLGINKDKVRLYNRINQKMIDEFFGTIKTNNVNNKKTYWWPYNYYFSPEKPEDTSHGWFDIDLLMRFYRSGYYGITAEMMEPFANTYTEVIHKGMGKITRNTDGTGGIKVNPGGIGWIHLLEFNPDMYDLYFSHYDCKDKLPGLLYGELVYAKHLMNKYYPNRTVTIYPISEK